MQSIDYDVNLDFLLTLPETPPKPDNDDKTRDKVLLQNNTVQPPVVAKVAHEADDLITPERRLQTKMPSIDRSTKPPSTTLNNSVPDTATNSGQSAASVTRINKKVTSNKNVDQPNSVPDTRSLNKPGPSTAVKPSSIPPPVAPDRSTKPVPPVMSSSSDVNAHSARVEKEQAELEVLQAKKMQEASALANLMREKRKLEMEMDKNKRQNDVQPRTR